MMQSVRKKVKGGFVHIARPLPRNIKVFEKRQVFSCASSTTAYIASKPVPHREILLEKNINENIFQWILGYPCAVKQIRENVGGVYEGAS